MSGQWKNYFEVKWRIENLRSWLNTRDDSFYSPQFFAETLMNTRWKLRLSREFSLADKYISLKIERDVDDDYPEPIALNYELSFLACDGSRLKSKSCTMKFGAKSVSDELNVKEAVILRERKQAYLPNGALTVCCKMWTDCSKFSKGGQCSIRSVIGRKCVTLDGTIDNFSMLDDNANVTVNFMSPSSEISFISFHVHREGSYMKFEKAEVKCKCFSSYSCKLFVLKTDGKQMECINSLKLLSLLTPHKSCLIYLDFYYYNLNYPEYLKDDTITFQIEITYNPGLESEYIKYDDSNYKKQSVEFTDLVNVNSANSEDLNSNPLDCFHQSEPKDKACNIENNVSSDENECFYDAGMMDLSPTTLKEDLTSLYNDLLFCDTELRTETETFPAHRIVLSARSPIFKEKFMKEKTSESVNVPGLSSDTVRRMLRFLYTDCTEDLNMQSAMDLYIASDEYDIASLKKRCSLFIKKNFCPANVCDVIALADMHQDKDLESAAHEFVLTYDKEVFGSDEWKLFMKNFSNLAVQVMYLKCMKE